MKRRKVGLALGGGAARGLAHIGVLEVLEKEGVHIDLIAGTSIGGLVGSLYCLGRSPDEIKSLAMSLGSRRFRFFADPLLSKSGLVRGRKLDETLKTIIGETRFEDLKIPFACVATDINNGKEVVIKEGLLREGLRASGSLPILFSVARWQGRYLVDGGLVNPIPVSVARAMGADFVIAVNVLPDRYAKDEKEPNIFTVVMQTIHISTYHLVTTSLSGADVIIQPQVAHITLADFHRAQECILQGKLAAQDAIPEIKNRLQPPIQ